MKNLYKSILLLGVLFLSYMANAQTNPIYVNFSCSGQSQPFEVPLVGTSNNKPHYSYMGGGSIDVVYSAGVNGGSAWIAAYQENIGMPTVIYYNPANTPEPPFGTSGWQVYSGGASCTLTQISSTATVLSTNENTKEYTIKIFPNPTKDVINFFGFYNATIYNTAGQKLGSYNNVKSADLSQYAKGVYFIVLTDKDGKEIYRDKVIKN